MQRVLAAQFSGDWCARAPYTAFHDGFLARVRGLTCWPSPAEYDDLASQVPREKSELSEAELPRFIAYDREMLRRVGGYERHIARARAVPTRAHSWHDFFNMAVWAHFPRLRWALNAVHVDDTLGPIDPRNARAPAQNAAAQFDESGLIVASSASDLLSELRALRFKHVFWERRQELLATTSFWVVGHGLLESLLMPHRGLSGKAMLLELARDPSSYSSDELRRELDLRVAERVFAWRSSSAELDPIPILGIPGYAANCDAHFYDDARYFRDKRRARQH